MPQRNEVDGTGEFRRDILELVVPIAGGEWLSSMMEAPL